MTLSGCRCPWAKGSWLQGDPAGSTWTHSNGGAGGCRPSGVIQRSPGTPFVSRIISWGLSYPHASHFMAEPSDSQCVSPRARVTGRHLSGSARASGCVLLCETDGGRGIRCVCWGVCVRELVFHLLRLLFQLQLACPGQCFSPWEGLTTASPGPALSPVWEGDAGCPGGRPAESRWTFARNLGDRGAGSVVPRRSTEATSGACQTSRQSPGP